MVETGRSLQSRWASIVVFDQPTEIFIPLITRGSEPCYPPPTAFRPGLFVCRLIGPIDTRYVLGCSRWVTRGRVGLL